MEITPYPCNHFFNLSLHRSGTQSTHDLFQRAQVPSVHWVAQVDNVDYQSQIVGRELDLDFVAETLRPVFDTYAHVSDLPVGALYAQLLDMYPDAKFYALYRDAGSWVDSVRRHVGDRAFEALEAVVYWSYFRNRPKRLLDIADTDLKAFHAWYYQSLSDFFAREKHDFLTLPLDARGLGSAICKFCTLPPVPMRHCDYRLGHDLTAPHTVEAAVTE